MSKQNKNSGQFQWSGFPKDIIITIADSRIDPLTGIAIDTDGAQVRHIDGLVHDDLNIETDPVEVLGHTQEMTTEDMYLTNPRLWRRKHQ